MKKLLIALAATLLFIVVLLSVHFVHMRWLPVNVVFYAAMVDAVIAAVITAVLVFFLRACQQLTGLEKTLLLVIWLLGGYAFAISVPTVIDRSLSFYILEKIDQRGGGIEQSAFETIFKEEYMVEHRLVDIRLTEQFESGTITLENGCVKLTPRGETLVRASRFYRQQLLPRKRLIMGEYTDALTDPFRDSAPRSDYQCE
ncbi:hypothetical protein GH984_10050 [Spiribacter sp. C176]|uniref:Uncharacterized protein n=1 Tax=Spiribacter salilacus TaxID=2664894 RepID=A0A6N7QUK9_9GAMM|nr:hypothetical protein [Spiribacter salilacus]MRH79043.1 hypothetical protein [Spiribacter salilacus]